MDDCCVEKSKGTYDLAVIGAGSAGFSAAIAAAEQGAQEVTTPRRSTASELPTCTTFWGFRSSSSPLLPW